MNGIQEERELQGWAREKRREPERRLVARPLARARRDLAQALRRPAPGLSVIAEPARRSPEEGRLRPDLNLAAFLLACQRSGVAAVALPTDARFGLTPVDLRALGSGPPLPLLHHDLLLSPGQLRDSVQLGADAVWLHAGVLEPGPLQHLLAEAAALGLGAVVEAADEPQLAAALEAGARLLCLSAFSEEGAQNLDRALELAALAPPGVVRIVRGPASGEAGLAAVRGRAEAIWICGPAVMPRDTVGYLRPLVERAAGG